MQNTGVQGVGNPNGAPTSAGYGATSSSSSPVQAPQNPTTPTPPVNPSTPRRKRELGKLAKRVGIVLLIVLILAGSAVVLFLFLRNSQDNSNREATEVDPASRFDTLQLPLNELAQAGSLTIEGSRTLSINGQLRVNNSLIIAPTAQPTNAVAGQLYYSQDNNNLAYFNGSEFVEILHSGDTVSNIGGITGNVTLGGGLNVTNETLNNTGVLSLQGQTGDISFTSGGGIAIDGTTLTNTGVLSLGGQSGAISVGDGLSMSDGSLRNSGVLDVVAGTPNLTVTNDGNGNLTISDIGGGSGTVSSPGGTAGRIAKFTGVQTIEDSLLSESGSVVTVNGDLAISGALSLSAPLSVSNGGTGANTAAGARSNIGAAASGANSDITSLSGLTTPLSVLQGGTGVNMLANNGVVIGQGTSALATVVAGGAGQCLVSTAGAPVFQACPGGSGVVSVNSLTGTLTIANASGAGSTITINDASTSTKGIAQFNGANFSVVGGVVNTVQDIHTTANPTFGQLTLSGDLAVNGGDITSGGALNITPAGVLTAGSTSQQTILQGNANTQITATGGGFTTTVGFNGSPSGNVVYNFDRAATAGTYTICSTAGNCTGLGGGVTTTGGTTNRLAKFSGAQAINDSTIADDGTNVTTSVDLVIQGGDVTIGVANTQTGTINLAHTGSAFVGSIAQGALTADRTYTLPDASGTVCLSSGNCSGGVTSLNGLAGVLTLANASGAGSTITIDNASTSAKGIAQFNGTNFSVVGGVVNTVQDINVAATPTFAGINTNNITPSGTLTVGATGQTLTLQGNATSTFSAHNGGNSTTLSFQSPTANVTYRFATAAAGNYDVCTTVGNCVGSGGGVTTSGGTTNRLAKFSGSQAINDSTISDDGTNVVTSVDLVVQGGDLTVGTASQQSSLILHDGNGQTTTLQAGDSGSNISFILPTANGSPNQCLKQGSGGQLIFDNCDGGSGGSSATLQTAYDNGNLITTSDGRDVDIVLSNTATDGKFDLIVADGSTGFASFTRSNGAGTADPAQMLLIDNLDADRALPVGIKLQASSGGMTTAIDASDAEIDTALNVGSNNIVGTTGNITFTNFSVDGATGNITTPGTITSGNINGQTISNTANFTGSLTVGTTLNVNTITPSSAMTVGSTGQDLTLQGSAATKLTATSGANTSTLNFTAPTANRTISLPDESGTVCLQNSTSCGFALDSGSGNYIQNQNTGDQIANFRIGGTGRASTALQAPLFDRANAGVLSIGTTNATSIAMAKDTTFSGDIAVNGGDITSSGTLTITPGGTLTVGATGHQLLLQGNASTQLTATGGGFTTSVGFNGTPVGNVTYNFDRSVAAGTYTLCSTIGNCAGVGGGVTTAGGTTNRLAKFSAGQAIADSTITDNGTNVTTSVDLVIQGGDATIGAANTQTGTLNFAHSGSAFLGSVVQGALTANRTYTLSDESGTFCFQNSANCGFLTSAAANGSYVQLQGSTPGSPQTGNLNISGTAIAGTAMQTPTIRSNTLDSISAGGTVSIGTTNATAGINLNQNTTVASGKTFTALGNSTFRANADSTTAFQVQNAASQSLLNVDSSGSNITLLGNNSPTLSTWATTTAMSVGANTNRVRGGAVAANGFLYHIGGVDGTGATVATVQYSKLNADGTVGTWASTTSLPGARRQFQAVVANGYLYVVGGRDASNTTHTTAYYAKLNADGTVGSWNTATALTAARFGHGAIAYNGYIYIVGGFNSSAASQSTVYAAKVNSSGTLGSWSTTSALPSGLANINGMTVANGYAYIAGGYTTGSVANIYRAKLNTDGTTSSWTTQSNVITGGGDENFQTFVANGYLYVIGGDNSNYVQAFQLNSDGSVGSSTALTNFPLNPAGETAGASANGYFYILGGSSAADGGGTVRNTVYYASTSRVKVGGNLDLVGITGENLAEGSSGGQLTAGDTRVVGKLQVQDNASFARAVTIGGTLSVSDDVSAAANINLAATTASTGVIMQAGSRWLHSAGDPTNFFAGLDSGNLTTTGFDNIGIGPAAMQDITSGFYNTAIGSSALTSNTDGIYNAALGYNALSSNVSGTFNTGLGARALMDTTGDFNTGVGGDALLSTTGNNNTALGYQALTLNETGNNNVAIGNGAGLTTNNGNANVSGGNNTFIGYNAGPIDTTQYTNAAAIGANAVVGRNNTVALGCIDGVNGCASPVRVGIGMANPQDLLHIDGGAASAAMIKFTNNTTGSSVGDGFNMGIDSNGTAFLQQREVGGVAFYTSNAFRMLLDGSGRLGISQTIPSYLLHVGSSSLTSGTQVAQFQAGASACNVVPGGTGFSCTSDQRLKKDIQGYSGALAAINQLDVKQYNMIDQPDDTQKQIGVMAQQLEKVLPSLVQTDERGYKSVSYAGLSPVLLQAIKEQQQQIDDLKQASQSKSANSVTTISVFGLKEVALVALTVALLTGGYLITTKLWRRKH